MPMLLLLACTATPPADDPVLLSGTEDTGGDDTARIDAAPEDLGDPYLGMIVAVDPGVLLDTCSIRIDVFADGSAVAGEGIEAAGREWVGIPLEGGSQYSASASYQDCTTYRPSDTVDSGTFSGVAGYFFLFWYNGANAGYATLEQAVDYHGGMATITLAEGADTVGIEAIAADLGVTLALREGTTWDATFPTELPVGKVLAAFSRDDAFVEGTPAWIVTPDWW